MFHLTKNNFSFFLPLGFVGLYRWFWFFVRILAYCLYKPMKPRKHPRFKSYKDVTILIPTIDSGEEIKMALRSWLRNKPAEVIFITIPSALAALEALASEVDPERQTVRVITVKKGNKRNQMVAGINQVKSDIIVFCDDDVVWPDTMVEWLIAPFEDRQMGGVGTSQTVITKNKHMTIWEILAAYRITMRNIEVTSSTYIDGGVCCLSGRTAAYRTAILRDPQFQQEFTHEFWRGKYHQHSGDDKFLTRWLHSHSWKTFIQCCPEAELASTFKDDWRFLKQLLRWTRNTWRSDIRSVIFERHIWTRHPFVAFSMVDKFFNPITLIAGPVTVAFLATRPDTTIPPWAIVVSYLAWLLLTRLIKYMPHFVKRPQDVLAIPVWLVFNMVFMFMKVYCLFTLYVTDWGTRAGADHKKDDAEADPKKIAEENDISDIFIPYWKMDQEDLDAMRAENGQAPIRHPMQEIHHAYVNTYGNRASGDVSNRDELITVFADEKMDMSPQVWSSGDPTGTPNYPTPDHDVIPIGRRDTILADPATTTTTNGLRSTPSAMTFSEYKEVADGAVSGVNSIAQPTSTYQPQVVMVQHPSTHDRNQGILPTPPKAP
ncbi:hypothetical protein BASA62_005120 [Batrachochytrium salamandrivorans]|nr:hypothetical protein BASA62_005120 [Batrachochytrium salamandrivorans]